MKTGPKVIVVFSVIWCISAVLSCIPMLYLSTWTMMHFDEYSILARWVILQMFSSVFVFPALFILLRARFYPEANKSFLAAKRMLIIVTIFYFLAVLFEINRYAHFVTP